MSMEVKVPLSLLHRHADGAGSLMNSHRTMVSVCHLSSEGKQMKGTIRKWIMRKTSPLQGPGLTSVYSLLGLGIGRALPANVCVV